MCPWESWPQAVLGFCEEPLFSWIKQPSNTWSNIGYLIATAWIWHRSKKDEKPWLRVLAIAAAVTGIGSAFFHATGTKWAGTADSLGMFLGTGALTALNVRRWIRPGWSMVYATFFGISFLFVGVAGWFPAAARWLYILGSPCCALEVRLALRDHASVSYRDYWRAWLIVGIAVVFWWLDNEKIWCDPSNHVLGGHALWHLLSALAFVLVYQFYQQFDLDKNV